MPFAQTLAGADFDGDHKPDGAVLTDLSSTYLGASVRTISLHFTGRTNSDLSFESSGMPLVISAVDVNRDGAADIVVEQLFTHKRLHVWLNDGQGGFRKVKTDDFPSANSGNGPLVDGPSLRRDSPALGLPRPPGPDLANPSIQSLRYRPQFVREHVPGGVLKLGLFAILPSSPRAPPASISL